MLEVRTEENGAECLLGWIDIEIDPKSYHYQFVCRERTPPLREREDRSQPANFDLSVVTLTRRVIPGMFDFWTAADDVLTCLMNHKSFIPSPLIAKAESPASKRPDLFTEPADHPKVMSPQGAILPGWWTYSSQSKSYRLVCKRRVAVLPYALAADAKIDLFHETELAMINDFDAGRKARE